MKAKELREAAICAHCKRPFGHTQYPLFWRITIERLGVDMPAIQRQDGLAMVLGGNAALADVMGPDEDLTRPMQEPVTITLCQQCALSEPVLIGVLAMED